MPKPSEAYKIASVLKTLTEHPIQETGEQHRKQEAEREVIVRRNLDEVINGEDTPIQKVKTILALFEHREIRVSELLYGLRAIVDKE